MVTAVSSFSRGVLPLVAGFALLAAVERRPEAAAPAALDDATVAHVLGRTGFGARPQDVARMRELGFDRYLDDQLHPERLGDAEVRSRLARFETLTLDSAEIAERYPLRAEPGAPRRQVLDELGAQKILRATYSPRQLEEVLVDFWFNHFNVFAGKGPVRIYLTEYERDAIRPHVLGRFRDLLGAVARSPAMLFYLDNWQSIDPKAAEEMSRRLDEVGSARGMRGRVARRRIEKRLGGREATPEAMAAIKARLPRGLNENYARELMELHTLGVGGGYTQADVVEVAKAFTGWTIKGPRQGGGYSFEDRRHTKGPKTVLGTTIDAGGERDGEAVLDLLAAHPSTARFIATKLARRFVADTPPAALVDRAAATFTATRGDLRAVVRTILASPEFVAAEARHAKIKTPFEFAVSALRATGAEVTDASAVLARLRTLGMPLYFAQPPTGYADTADAWINTGALVNRMNFAVDLAANRIAGVRVDLPAEAVDALALGSPEFQRK
jgi:uncharacterized protein (DUF1800 family)